MGKICSKCRKETYYDNDLHCRKIFKDKIFNLLMSNEIEKAKLLFDSELFDEKWKKSLLNELRVKCEAGRILNKLVEVNIQLKEETTKPDRVVRCYNCKESLSGSTHKECLDCHWFVCKCGVCGCQYSF
ncbi:MAG: hypothetical protein NTZ87_02915 [Candidatus Nomurabacteria bacterium]|nr:hypothetical protein [Candidatus Nomurabacteria bacterium]